MIQKLSIALTLLFLAASVMLLSNSHAEGVVRATGTGVVESVNAPKAIVKRTKAARANAKGSASAAIAPKAAVKVRK